MDIPTVKRPHFELFQTAVDGFVPSIVAIGCVRAWLSFQTGISSVYETNIANSPDLKLVQYASFIMFFIVFSFIKLGSRFQARRSIISSSIGILGAIAYAAGLLFADQSAVLGLIITIFLAGIFVWMIRLWGEDNCTANYEVILVRLGLSFIVQYIVYASVLVLPKTAQCISAVMLSVIMGLCLSKKPTAVVSELEKTTEAPSVFKSALLVVLVGFCCAGHGALFLSSDTVSGVWILGPLIIAGITLSVVTLLKNSSLFRGLVCITLFFQCLSVILVLAFSSSFDWISLSKSLSYSVSMTLTLSIGCRLGMSLDKSHGRSICRWMAVYFIAFYGAKYLGAWFGLDNSNSLIVVMFCLVFAALPIIGRDWATVFSSDSKEDTSIQLSKNELAKIQNRLADSCGLTPRESEVLFYLLEGISVKEIAAEGHVTKNTVRTQVQSVYRKLDIHSREDLKNLIKTSEDK